MAGFLVALTFLTIVPVPFRSCPSSADVGRSRFWFPVVGLLLGAVLGAAARGAVLLNSPALGALLVLALWVVLTGALHLDGLCDLCDGLAAARPPEERFRILRDPHLGTFGLVGGVLLLLAKFVAIQELMPIWSGRLPWLVGAAVVSARCLVLWMAGGSRYPRADGAGKALVEATSAWEGTGFGIAALAAVAAIQPLTGLPVSVVPVLAALAGVALLRLACHARLGGITGDCLGAGIELAEVLFLLTAALQAAVSPG
jgi:adenosylcobinamide-GDP ribazoletransferase